MSQQRRVNRNRQRKQASGGTKGAEPRTLPAPNWQSLDDYEGSDDQARYPNANMALCRKTGVIYVRPIIGRYRHWPRKRLRERLSDLEVYYAMVSGGSTMPPAGDELWFGVEWLENILAFETEPPCGCAPEHKVAAA